VEPPPSGGAVGSRETVTALLGDCTLYLSRRSGQWSPTSCRDSHDRSAATTTRPTPTVWRRSPQCSPGSCSSWSSFRPVRSGNKLVRALGQEVDNRFLRLRRLLPACEHLHDLLLDAVRTLEPPLEIRLRVRTRDPRAALLFAAEVDDPAGKTPQVTVRGGARSPVHVASAGHSSTVSPPSERHGRRSRPDRWSPTAAGVRSACLAPRSAATPCVVGHSCALI
jgi:hypothetical protein